MSHERSETPKGDVLVVDDTPANLRLLSKILTEQGYHVRPVSEGQLALAAVQAEPPDLILLDIRMPGMNGYEVCGQLKANTQTCDIRLFSSEGWMPLRTRSGHLPSVVLTILPSHFKSKRC